MVRGEEKKGWLLEEKGGGNDCVEGGDDRLVGSDGCEIRWMSSGQDVWSVEEMVCNTGRELVRKDRSRCG